MSKLHQWKRNLGRLLIGTGRRLLAADDQAAPTTPPPAEPQPQSTNAPPAHWLALVRERAPQFLENSQHPEMIRYRQQQAERQTPLKPLSEVEQQAQRAPTGEQEKPTPPPAQPKTAAPNPAPPAPRGKLRAPRVNFSAALRPLRELRLRRPKDPNLNDERLRQNHAAAANPASQPDSKVTKAVSHPGMATEAPPAPHQLDRAPSTVNGSDQPRPQTAAHSLFSADVTEKMALAINSSRGLSDPSHAPTAMAATVANTPTTPPTIPAQVTKNQSMDQAPPAERRQRTPVYSGGGIALAGKPAMREVTPATSPLQATAKKPEAIDLGLLFNRYKAKAALQSGHPVQPGHLPAAVDQPRSTLPYPSKATTEVITSARPPQNHSVQWPSLMSAEDEDDLFYWPPLVSEITTNGEATQVAPQPAATAETSTLDARQTKEQRGTLWNG